MSRRAKPAAFLEEVYPVTVSGRHVHVTESMKNYAIDKVSKLERFSERIIDVNITMDIQKLEHRVDIVVMVDNTKIKAHAATNDMYASIDKAVHKLETQLVRYRDKLHNHHCKGVKDMEMTVNVIPAPADMEDVLFFEPFVPHVVKQETRPLKTLTVDEAVMKMELSGDQFMVFRQESDLKLKVIYHRTDGNYGVIEPET